MTENHDKLRFALYGISTVIALIIIADFILPGKIISNEIIKVVSERQQYYNAAGNSHQSYKVITNDFEFSVSEDFAELVKENDKIEYAVSIIFNEVNWYKLPKSENKSTYSLRMMSALVLPMLSIISILMAYKSKWNIDIVVFVLQVLLVADLIFLMV